MTAFWGVVRLEVRLRQRDLLVCGAALVAALAAMALGVMAPREAGSGDFLRGGVLLLIVMLGTVRTIAAHRPWSDLRVALPLADRPRVFGRLGVRAVLALMVGVAFALWASPAGDRRLVHITTTVLWFLLAGEAASLLLQFRGNGLARLALPLGIVSAIALMVSSHAVLGDLGPTSGLMQTLRSLGVPLMIVVACAVTITPEWFPTSAPKAVRPRSRLLGGLLRRKPRARSPRQVLRAMGGVPEADLGFLIQIWSYGVVAFLAFVAEALGDDPGASWAPLLFLVGIFSVLTLRVAARRWSQLRAYPIRAREVWGKPIGGVVGVVGSGVLLAVLLGPANSTPRIAHSPRTAARGKVDRPILYAPGWARADEASGRRPPGMPAPQYRGAWRLRGAGSRWESRREGGPRIWSPRPAPASMARQHRQPRRYFHAALRYYLHLVHGVTITTRELDEALGEPVVITKSSAYIPPAYYGEYIESGGTWLSSHPHSERAGQVRVDVFPHDRRSVEQRVVPVSPPLELYTFAPALRRLESILEHRLVRAARLTFSLDLMLLVLLYLAFVRLALITGPMRWALPLLPLLVGGAWSGSRAGATRLAIRDAHLADPWVMVVTAVLVGATLVWSIVKQLGRLSQTSTAG